MNDDLLNLFKNNTHLLLNGRWGLEKETLRITHDGYLALSLHPENFGNKRTNPYITTDFSESQIEMITPALDSMEKTLRFLGKLQTYIEENIGDELLWNYSMPCILGSNDEIPVSMYDDSPDGRENRIYRNGLAIRYGKRMQMISGIHYNFSFGEYFWDFYFKQSKAVGDIQKFKNLQYLRLARNHLRYRWLLIYLFGATPAADESFYDNRFKTSVINNYNMTATSLRMSRLGYSSAEKEDENVSLNSLDEYIHDLEKKLTTKRDDYEKLGLYNNGNQIQMNYHICQKENELYSPVRLKSGNGKNSNIGGLKDKGIGYLEFRSIDLNPFYKNSIGISMMRFIHLFIIFCLFGGDEYLSADERKLISDNDTMVTLYGRKKGLMLTDIDGQKKSLGEMATGLIFKISKVAKLLDINHEYGYEQSIADQQDKITNPDLLPSAMIMNLLDEKDMDLTDLVLTLSKKTEKGGIHEILNKGV